MKHLYLTRLAYHETKTMLVGKYGSMRRPQTSKLAFHARVPKSGLELSQSLLRKPIEHRVHNYFWNLWA